MLTLFRRLLLGIFLAGAAGTTGCTSTDGGGTTVPIESTVQPVSVETGGYGTLVPPTSRPVGLVADQLVDGFEIDPFVPGRCRFDNRSELSRLGAGGEVRWRTEVPWDQRINPLVVDERVIGTSSRDRPSVFAVSLADGAPEWQRFVDVGIFGLTAGPEGPLLQVSDRPDGILEHLNSANGEPVESNKIRRSFEAPIVVDDLIVLDRPDGLAGWRGGAEVWRVPSEGELGGVSLHDGLLVARYWPATVVAFRVADGTEVWRWTTDRPNEYASLPEPLVDTEGVAPLVLNLGFSYEAGVDPPEDGSADGVVALDAATGEELWSRRGVQARRFGEVLALGSPEGSRTQSIVRAIDGTEAWSMESGENVKAGYSDYLVLRRFDVLEEQAERRLVRASDGTEIWQPGAGSLTFVGRAGDRLVVGMSPDSSAIDGTQDGTLVVLDQDGNEAWQVSFRDQVSDVQALDDGDLLVLTRDPALFCD